ncbi:MAG: sensor histidine kinase [Afipia sp.]|nr:sensor histidine kinase [Afipia sp.]
MAIEPDGRNSRLEVDQLRLALRNVEPNFWLMPTFGVIMCVMFSVWIDWQSLIAWWLIVTIGGLPLGYVCHKLLRSRHEEIDDVRWLRIAIASYALFAAGWASMGVFLWRHGSDMDQMLLMLIVGCTLAGNSALIGSCKPFTFVGYAVYGTTLVVMPLREGGLAFYGLSGLAFLFVCYLAYMSRNIYDTARDMLRLRYDKNDLIEALAKSKVESDRARERAEKASRTKSQFLANMSHELRTPLNAILGFSEMIHSGAFGTSVAKHMEYAKIIHGSGHHLLALINDILDLAKIEAGGMQLRADEVDLKHLIEDSVRLLDAKARDGGLALRAELPADLPKIVADERALKQILLNLLSNAVKFTPAGGNVSAFADVDQDGCVIFGVSDTGLGIAKDDRARVFENFGQGRHDVTTADKGTGLGLPIVKGLAEAHGGSITLESEVGKGTCVTIRMPAERVCRSAIFRVAS